MSWCVSLLADAEHIRQGISLDCTKERRKSFASTIVEVVSSMSWIGIINFIQHRTIIARRLHPYDKHMAGLLHAQNGCHDTETLTAWSLFHQFCTQYHHMPYAICHTTSFLDRVVEQSALSSWFGLHCIPALSPTRIYRHAVHDIGIDIITNWDIISHGGMAIHDSIDSIIFSIICPLLRCTGISTDPNRCERVDQRLGCKQMSTIPTRYAQVRSRVQQKWFVAFLAFLLTVFTTFFDDYALQGSSQVRFIHWIGEWMPM